uniref:Uncharacterized protein n=1 Tax=Oryza meridionalis TaxID=40149 RepID=A0A0E0C0S3_9ORYZ
MGRGGRQLEQIDEGGPTWEVAVEELRANFEELQKKVERDKRFYGIRSKIRPLKLRVTRMRLCKV